MSNYVNLCKELNPTSVVSTTSDANWSKVSQWLSALIATSAIWRQRYRQRQLLLELSSNRLEDIGITKGQAEEEAAKPFWVS